MPILMRIALRNLREHKAKTLIVGVLIALGILILTLGNSVLATAAVGIERSFIDSFTGHILVRAEAENPVTIAGAQGFSSDITGQTIPNYDRVYEYVSGLDQVTAANPQITFFGTIDFSTEEKSKAAIAPIFGVEPESYLNMFPDSLQILEGRFLEPGESGVVLPAETVKQIREDLNEDIQVGDEVRIQGFSGGPGGGGGGIRIRRLELLGVYEYLVDAGNTQPYAFIDASTVRSMAGMVVGSADAVNIDQADSSLLDTGDEMFGGDDMFAEEDLFADDALFSSDVDTVETDLNDDNLYGILGDTSERAMASRPDAGAWTYILLRLEDDSQTTPTLLELNGHFQQEGWAVEAVDWSEASGGVAQFNQAFQVFFYVVVIILSVVSVIIIMNTLVISVIERTKEIGTMRSLGAQKKVVRRMFIAETMSISLVFGTIGLLLGLLIIWILNMVGITAPNPFFEVLFGGSTLRPILDSGAILSSYLIMLGIGLISSWYPVRVALKIQPLEAMQAA